MFLEPANYVIPISIQLARLSGPLSGHRRTWRWSIFPDRLSIVSCMPGDLADANALSKPIFQHQVILCAQHLSQTLFLNRRLRALCASVVNFVNPRYKTRCDLLCKLPFCTGSQASDAHPVESARWGLNAILPRRQGLCLQLSREEFLHNQIDLSWYHQRVFDLAAGIADKSRNILDNYNLVLYSGHKLVPAFTHLACAIAATAIMGIRIHLHLLFLESDHTSSSGQMPGLLNARTHK